MKFVLKQHNDWEGLYRWLLLPTKGEAAKKERKESIESCGWKSWLRHYIVLKIEKIILSVCLNNDDM